MRFTTKKLMKFVKGAVFALALCIIFTGCSDFFVNSTEKVDRTALLLGTVVTITLYGAQDDALIDACLEKCAEYEKIFSRTDPESELYRLNELDCLEVSQPLLEVLRSALYWCEKTDGAFDITLGGVSDLYGFTSGSPRVPTAEELSEALRHVGYEKIKIEGSTVTLTDSGTVVDLGAIAKGYIADELAAFLRESGCSSAIINLGGNILCVGEKPDGSAFTVGLQYPVQGSQRTIGSVSVRDMSVVTSGVYERSFEEGGALYHHILSPETGLPYSNGLLAVSIAGAESEMCDALSTVCFALGLDEGLELINSLEGVEAAFVTEDFGLHYSDGFGGLES